LKLCRPRALTPPPLPHDSLFPCFGIGVAGLRLGFVWLVVCGFGDREKYAHACTYADMHHVPYLCTYTRRGGAYTYAYIRIHVNTYAKDCGFGVGHTQGARVKVKVLQELGVRGSPRGLRVEGPELRV
jgi:hypothetical protein